MALTIGYEAGTGPGEEEGSYYIYDGKKKVGGPYDRRVSAEAALAALQVVAPPPTTPTTPGKPKLVDTGASPNGPASRPGANPVASGGGQTPLTFRTGANDLATQYPDANIPPGIWVDVEVSGLKIPNWVGAGALTLTETTTTYGGQTYRSLDNGKGRAFLFDSAGNLVGEMWAEDPTTNSAGGFIPVASMGGRRGVAGDTSWSGAGGGGGGANTSKPPASTKPTPPAPGTSGPLANAPKRPVASDAARSAAATSTTEDIVRELARRQYEETTLSTEPALQGYKSVKLRPRSR